MNHPDEAAIRDIIVLYSIKYGANPEAVIPLAESGSSRRYFRVRSDEQTVIGVFHEEIKENDAFLSFSRTFRSVGLPVPEILTVSPGKSTYLQTDLGDITLFAKLQEHRSGGGYPEANRMFPEEIRKAYREVIQWLPKFQQATPDYAKCYPRGAFDSQSMLWDLSYFKYYYLKLAGVAFNEQLLEDDFHTLTSFLLQAYGDFFMYRDFQSRNIMMHQGHPWFIDYQGGRKGALQYDIASLLYDAKADIPPQMRDELLEYYLEQLDVNKMPGGQVFLKFFPAFVLIRILQALGAYGFRGYYQKKQHFLQSIPYALRNLELLMRKPLNVKLPELMKVLTQMIIMGQIPTGTELRTASGTPHPKPIKNMLSSTVYPGPGKIPEPGNGVTENDAGREEHLTVSIHSFSYKKGLTVDTSGNGGGFIFDCRALPNPGRHEEYRDLTGKDREVIEYLQDEPDVAVFLNNVFTLVDQSVEIYIMRGFTHLMVSFGCTGGQHRSVYCAERLARHLKEKYSIRMLVTHREQMPAKGA